MGVASSGIAVADSVIEVESHFSHSVIALANSGTAVASSGARVDDSGIEVEFSRDRGGRFRRARGRFPVWGWPPRALYICLIEIQIQSGMSQSPPFCGTATAARIDETSRQSRDGLPETSGRRGGIDAAASINAGCGTACAAP